MSFAAPIFLLAALIVPLLAGAWLFERRRRRRYAVRFPGASVVAAVTGKTSAWRRRLPPALLALAACALAIALARPEATIAVPVEQASVVLVTDKSGSMSATDVAPSRLEAARRAAESFLDEVPDELLVGFVGYATSTESVLEPTRDRDAVRATLGALQADGGTATGDALGAALDRLEARKGRSGRVAPAAIVLLSDGKTTQGGDPLEAAARARQLGVPVYTVALGTPDGVLPNGPMGQAVPVPPDPETLRAIAERSGGQAFEVEDAGELEGIYERLGSQIGTREEQREISAGFAAAGLLLLLGGVGAGLRWRGRLP
jgi:Ca-activated chloride channel family protein